MSEGSEETPWLLDQGQWPEHPAPEFDPAIVDEITRTAFITLERKLNDRNEWSDHLAARESALLLAVPRPFRTFVHRRAERIQRRLEAS